MMRTIVVGCLTALLVAVTGMGVLRLLGEHPQRQPMLAALGAAIVAIIFAGTPMVIARNRSQIAVTQAGLISTVAHLLMLIVAGAVLLFSHLIVGSSFVFWLCAMYLSTLIALVACISVAIHKASPSFESAELKTSI